MELLSVNKCFGGWHKRYQHFSNANNCDMTFSVFLPPASEVDKVPVLFWLSGLTCNDQNFMQKAGAFSAAADLGIIVIAPDTSPRGDHVPDDPEEKYDLGMGAGFYLNATQKPWHTHYNMYDYVVKELVKLVDAKFPVMEKRAISGHSMGGHGALTIGLKNPDIFTSISAFSPICNPIESPWGIKAFTQYLGANTDNWLEYDACELMQYNLLGVKTPMLIDQGTDDEFLEQQLKPNNLKNSAAKTNYPLTLRMQDGYDHSYFFISSFIGEHLHFHIENLES